MTSISLSSLFQIIVLASELWLLGIALFSYISIFVIPSVNQVSWMFFIDFIENKMIAYYLYLNYIIRLWKGKKLLKKKKEQLGWGRGEKKKRRKNAYIYAG